MSALGHKQTFAPQNVMSALPPKADVYWLFLTKESYRGGQSPTSEESQSRQDGLLVFELELV